jgi:hypothetical protein
VVATAGALVLGTLLPTAVAAEPTTLTASELNGITAGGIRVDAMAFAQASGDHALARTRTEAFVSTIDERDLGVGFAEGLAFACCGPESDVDVRSSVSSTGETIHSKSYAVTFRGATASRDNEAAHFIYGYTASFLVARSPGDRPDPGQAAVREPRHHLEAPLAGLVEVGPTRERGRVVTGFEFEPVFVAGLQWHLFRDLLAATPTRSTPPMASLRRSPTPLLQAPRTSFGLLP